MRRTITLVLGSVVIGALNVAPAFAAETTPPRLSMLPYAGFLQGGQIAASPAPVNGEWTEQQYTDYIPMFTTWRGSDASGICGYDVNAVYAGMEPQNLISGTRRTRYDGASGDYDGSFGGGSTIVTDWQVVARDCAGNTTVRAAAVSPRVSQEYGQSVTYTGRWSTSKCRCWSHGAVRQTTQKGAAATIRLQTRANGTAGLVMEKAPDRGRFTLFVDGVNRGTIDTYAPVPTHRVIVWSGRFATAGTHTVRLVNQATPGRPKIDLDAILQNGVRH